MVNEYAEERYVRDEKEKAKKNLLDVLDIETISLKTWLSINEIEEIKRGN